MNINIRKYDPLSDYERLLEIIEAEGEEWKDYLQPNYRKALEQSTTYVASFDGQLCGYSRTISDHGLCVWIMDLLVDQKYRGHSVGKRLMECLFADFPDQEIFVLSDADGYYQKLGYKNEGTIFKVK